MKSLVQAHIGVYVYTNLYVPDAGMTVREMQRWDTERSRIGLAVCFIAAFRGFHCLWGKINERTTTVATRPVEWGRNRAGERAKRDAGWGAYIKKRKSYVRGYLYT